MYRTTTVPYLATCVLKQLALDGEKNYPHTAEIIHYSFSMDDGFCGALDINTSKELVHQLTKLLESAGMKLHKWFTNDHGMVTDFLNKDRNYSFFSTSEATALRNLWKTNLVFHLKCINL